jgi:putative FmdB family regulatory protein
MPIYAYKCAECGHQMDVIRKVSDPPLTECPSCGKSALVKQVTAAGFQLKGAGWYVTDFRDQGSAKKKDEAKADDKAATEQPADAKAETKSDTKADGGTDSKSVTKTETKTDAGTKAAAAPAPASSPPPAAGGKSGGSS